LRLLRSAGVIAFVALAAALPAARAADPMVRHDRCEIW